MSRNDLQIGWSISHLNRGNLGTVEGVQNVRPLIIFAPLARITSACALVPAPLFSRGALFVVVVALFTKVTCFLLHKFS